MGSLSLMTIYRRRGYRDEVEKSAGRVADNNERNGLRSSKYTSISKEQKYETSGNT